MNEQGIMDDIIKNLPKGTRMIRLDGNSEIPNAVPVDLPPGTVITIEPKHKVRFIVNGNTTEIALVEGQTLTLKAIEIRRSES